MRHAIGAAIMVSSLLVLAACGSAGATPAATVTAAAPMTVRPSAAPTTAPPVVEKHTITKRRAIPFATRRVLDPTLAKGTRRVTTRGVAGVRILTYRVIFTNGVQTAKKLIRGATVKAPTTRVIVIGTKQAPRCDPNYSGCVPIASDVDCAGGSGNGPAYVQGPVRVIGTDIYGLDADGDGIGCDS